MEQKVNTQTKKRITVNVENLNPEEQNNERQNIDKQDSKTPPRCSVDNQPVVQNSNEPRYSECEVQVVDLESDGSIPPILQLFPELNNEGFDFETLNRTSSTTALTKMLVGKRPKFSLLRSSKMPGSLKASATLAPIRESNAELESSTSSDTSVVNETPRRRRKRKYKDICQKKSHSSESDTTNDEANNSDS